MKNTTTKEKKAALYDPYLDTMGGGEKHILSILKVLDDHDYEITIFWDTDLTDEIVQKLGLKFKRIRFKKNIFKYGDLLTKTKELSQYDTFFYVTDGSYFFSTAKQNFVFCMVPQKSLYNMGVANKLKTRNVRFIANSEFTRNWLSKWGIQAEVLYPYLPDEYINQDTQKKEKIILSVGRFFRQLHSKRQDIAIQWFMDLQKSDARYTDYELHLAGSVLPSDTEYLKELQESAKGYPNIHFHTNISYSEILTLYKRAEYYWHFAGYDIDQEEHPERTEHLGITPLEAMASGCLTFAYRAGGPSEIIQDNETGFLFRTQEELFEKMKRAEDIRTEVLSSAKAYVSRNFSYQTFRKQVEHIILNQ